MTIRKIEKSEYEELRSVWCDVFGDEPIYVDELYSTLKAEGYTCEDQGELHAFLTLFDVGEINGQQIQVSYAICTRPESRGKGYASELIKYVRDIVTSNGNISLICPADDSLSLFYHNLGYEIGFFAKEQDAEACELNLRVRMIGHMKYNKLREEFLADIPHSNFTNRFMKFVKADSVNAQGLLLINGGDAICTISGGTDEEMILSELIVNPALSALSSEIAEQIASGLASLFEVERIYFRTPTFIVYTDESGDKYSRGSYVQAMIAGCKTELDTASILPYYGLPLD